MDTVSQSIFFGLLHILGYGGIDLKKTSVLIMIIECAFMSNPTEAALLGQENYQEKVAWAIYMGIMQFLNS